MTTNELINQAEDLTQSATDSLGRSNLDFASAKALIAIANALIAIAKTQVAIENANHAYMVDREEAHQ
jgi:hypothetical protein